ncbi:dTDP-glucose 4,6-dehydratase [Candidatus Parvarchaeota archaeon]|nr:MAG: dTDP-glucose 4,6-dehydratase [Candidatus Parvarchaeota archaeon]PXY71506.1 MAG: dTDP-glucose 4,6-dehydratase [Candidatus Parvarchaeota archaeon]
MHNRIIITGGAGFIGSNFIRYMTKKYPNYQFINIDNLTYSGNKNNLKDLESSHNYQFIEEDICNTEAMNKVIKEGDIVINFAAESHVDNSIKNPSIFIKTNVLGTHSILEAARKKKAKLFLQISTDEVYGSLNFEQESSKETHFLKPSSPYSGSKAAAEMVCIGNIRTFQQPIIITRSSNNFGPYQYPEKVIPLFLTNLFEDKKVPLYGEGKNVRDWIYVEDNCSALDTIIHQGIPGDIYNIGGGNEISNFQLTKEILKTCGKDESSIEYVEDRLGHDLRYSIDSSKTKSLGWKPQHDFKDALKLTVEWYKNNPGWWEPLKK